MTEKPKYYLVEKEGPIVIWKFSNPPKNLRTIETGTELVQLVEDFENDEELRVGIITSATPGKFIQHFDVSQIIDWAEGIYSASDEELAQIKSTMPPPKGLGDYTSKPIICAINGPVEGGGCELALACDFRFISNDTFMGQPEVGAGFPPGEGIPRLIQLIGLGRTMELCLTGRRVYAEEAERIGLVTRACRPEELMATVMAFAGDLASKPPIGLSLTRQAVYGCSDLTLEEGLKLNRELFFDAIRTDDAMNLMRLYVASGQDREKMMELVAEAGSDPKKLAEVLSKKKDK